MDIQELLRLKIPFFRKMLHHWVLGSKPLKGMQSLHLQGSESAED